MKNNTITIIIILIVAGGAGFLGDVKYQQNKQPAFNRQFGAIAGQRGGGNGGIQGRNGGIRPVSGEVISSDDKSITVKLADGSSKIILISATTVINKADQATMADIKTGEKVAVFGQTNQDGSVTAQNIQLNPVQRIESRPSPGI